MAGFGLSESVLQFRQSAVFSQSTVFEKKGEREADQEDACDDTRSTGEVQGPSGWIHAQAESGRVAMPGCAGDSETQECALGGQDCDGQAERCGVNGYASVLHQRHGCYITTPSQHLLEVHWFKWPVSQHGCKKRGQSINITLAVIKDGKPLIR